nr:immunoglobulin light chain junction region [Macaca mulatta]
CMQALDVPWTF